MYELPVFIKCILCGIFEDCLRTSSQLKVHVSSYGYSNKYICQFYSYWCLFVCYEIYMLMSVCLLQKIYIQLMSICLYMMISVYLLKQNTNIYIIMSVCLLRYIYIYIYIYIRHYLRTLSSIESLYALLWFVFYDIYMLAIFSKS